MNSDDTQSSLMDGCFTLKLKSASSIQRVGYYLPGCMTSLPKACNRVLHFRVDAEMLKVALKRNIADVLSTALKLNIDY